MAQWQNHTTNRMLPGLLSIITALAASAASPVTNPATFDCPKFNASLSCSCRSHDVNCDNLAASNMSFIASSASSIEIFSAAFNDIRELPIDLLRATSLKRLTLSHNKIASFDSQLLVSMTSLVFLDLSYNELTKFYLPGNVLPMLQYLNLTNNNLIQLKFYADRPNKNFSLLRLNENNISDLNDTFHYDGLDQLFLEHNNIGNNLGFLKNLTKLRKLTLGSNNISEISSDCFPCRNYLNFLYLNDNNLRNLEFLNCTTFLYELDVSSNMITEIPEMTFSKLIILDTLSLADNKITDSKFLRYVSNAIVYLDISGNKLSNIGGSYWINKTKLQNLDMSHNELTDLNFVVYLENLKTLLADNNKIINIDGAALLNVYSRKSPITNLTLSNNFISDVTFLRYFSNLRYLNLCNNTILHITDETMLQLTYLYELDLSNNRIEDVRFVRNLPSIRFLNLSNNQVTELPCNRPVQRLFLDGNHLTSLELDCTPNLQYLSVYGGTFRDRKIQDLRTSKEVILNINNKTITFPCVPSVTTMKKCEVVCDSSDALTTECEQRVTLFLSPIAIVLYCVAVPMCLLAVLLIVAKCRMRRKVDHNKQCLCKRSENALIDDMQPNDRW